MRAADARPDALVLLLGEVRELVELDELELLAVEPGDVVFVLAVREPDEGAA
jgi:hypothetical protein